MSLKLFQTFSPEETRVTSMEQYPKFLSSSDPPGYFYLLQNDALS